ncbi:MAG: flagellar hook-basal body complex protein FliE [Firmicutes bacterium]|nr:flagellar hook-basal body complex protein FliE [Bacillota bacterium]
MDWLIGKSLDISSFPRLIDFKLDKPEKTQETKPGFAGLLSDALKKVNELQHRRTQAELALATGGDISLHEVMVITEQARLALDLTLAIRNKVMDAYNEVMRMQI